MRELNSQAASDWLYIYPRGIQELLLYTKKKFNNPVIYITENGNESLRIKIFFFSSNKLTICMYFDVNTGVDETNDGTKSLEDNMRIDYISNHLYYVHSAIQ